MLDHQHCAAGVDDKGPIPDGGVHMFDSHVTQDFFALRCCGIIMKDVQATMTVLHKTVELADGLFVRNVEVPRIRSEEHTSELQSLMRISYAVFCLKKKKKQTTDTYKIT